MFLWNYSNPSSALALEDSRSGQTIVYAEAPVLKKSKLPDSSNSEIRQALRTLEDFFLNELYPAVPLSVHRALQGKRLVIYLEPKSDVHAADAIFDADATRASGDKDLIIRLNSKILLGDSTHPLMAHEFFHVAQYLLRKGEEPWVREGLAQHFEAMIRYPSRSVVKKAFKNPSTTLNSEYSVALHNPTLYGHAYLYFTYLMRECELANSPLLWLIAKGGPKRNARGIKNITLSLKMVDRWGQENGYAKAPKRCLSFQESYRAFVKAWPINQFHLNQDTQSAQYYVHYTTQKVEPAQPPKEIEVALQRLPALTPIYWPGDTVLPKKSKLPKNLEYYWIKKTPTFRVQTTPPSQPSSSWVLLLVKIPK